MRKGWSVIVVVASLVTVASVAEARTTVRLKSRPVVISLDPVTGEPLQAPEEAEEEEEAEAVQPEAGAAAVAVDPDGEGEAEEAGDAALTPEAAEAGEMPTDPKEYGEWLRGIVTAVRGRVLEKITEKILAKQDASMDRIATVLSYFSMAGVLLLFLPLVLRRKHPGKTGVLFKYSALAAVMFFVAVNLFAVVLVLLRSTQGALGEVTNPQVAIVNGTFDAIEKNADELLVMNDIIQPTLVQLTEPDTEGEPMPVLLLNNVQRIGKDLAVFKSIGNFFKGMSWIFGYLPIVLTIVALVLFVIAAKPVLMNIVQLPARAASGEAGVGKRVVKETFKRVGREFLATLMLIGVLIVLTILAGGILGQVIEPAIEAFLGYLMVAVIYIQVTDEASSFWVLASLGGTVVFLLLNLLTILLSSMFYIGKAQKLFQQKLHDKVPFRAHKRFWGWGTLGVIWLQVFPWLYILGAKPLVELVIEKSIGGGGDDPSQLNWPLILTSGPAVLVLLFIFAFWAFRGLKALTFLAKYKVKGQAAVGAAEDPALSLPQPQVGVR